MLARAPLPLAIAAALVAPGPASAKPTTDTLWATVNVCDTVRQPDRVGVRAAMPAGPRGAVRRMRFRLQWREGDRWRYVSGADSGWRRAPLLDLDVAESGWSFTIAPPTRRITFRGVVRFRWTQDGRIVRAAREVTEGGHRSTAGADPEDYSAATCSIG